MTKLITNASTTGSPQVVPRNCSRHSSNRDPIYTYTAVVSIPASSPLSFEAVIAEATQLLQEEGFEALTMRRLAARCDVTAMSLYRHVQTKEELLVILANRLLAHLDVPEVDSQDWRSDVAAVFSALHRMWLAHPEFAQIVAAQPADGKVAYRWMEHVFAALERAGLSDPQIVAAYDTLASYTAGFNQQHTGRRSPAAASTRLAALRQIEAAEFPHVAAFAEQLTTRDAARGFDEGLNLILDGIAKQAANKPGRSARRK
jgi:AcrR family transcriptional regulator